MDKINTLPFENDEVWFDFDKKDKVSFLKYLKSNGCMWINGDKIKPYLDNIRPPMSLSKSLKLSFVSFIVAGAVLNKKNKDKLIKFSN